MRTFAIVTGLLLASLLSFVGCSGGGGDLGQSSGGGASASPDPASTARGPGASCVTKSDDAGSRSFSDRVCAANPALPTCRMCLELSSNSDVTCEYACRLGGSDCPAGQTCRPQPSGSSSTGGDCDGLGYCK